MRFVVISSDRIIKNEIRHISSLFESGLEVFHLRKPGMPEDQIRNIIKQIPEEFIGKIMLHGNVDLLNEFNLMGIHVNESTRKDGPQMIHLFPTKKYSTSFHHPGDLENCNDKYDYVFFSPVFKSISKENYLPLIGLDAICSSLRRTQQRVVALGGITPFNIMQLRGCGFCGVASLGYIWEVVDPLIAFKKMKKIVETI